jgi:hypothetical protein
MATSPKPTLVEREPVEGTPVQREPVHTYHAQANLLEADLKQPLMEKITPRKQVKLPRDGHYQFKQSDPFRFEGIISYQSGYTQVAGHRSTRAGHGFTTLATAVVEGLNVLDVVTADRVVGQISTEHPLFPEGPVPAVTFLGTRFDNLRIGGHPVTVNRHLRIIGPRRGMEVSYFDDESVVRRVSDQYASLHTDFEKVRNDNRDLEDELSGWMRERYPIDRPPVRAADNGSRTLQCSLVDSVAIEQAPGVRPNGNLNLHHVTFGHVIHVPHFGKIVLAELTLNFEKAQKAKKPEDQEHDKYTFELKMIHVDMGCLAKGTATVVTLDANGGGKG